MTGTFSKVEAIHCCNDVHYPSLFSPVPVMMEEAMEYLENRRVCLLLHVYLCFMYLLVVLR